MTGSDRRFSGSTLVDLLRWRASEGPEIRAYTYLADGEREETSWTFVEVDRRARAVGALIRAAGAAGQPVLLVFPSGLEFIAGFFGCLYAGAIPVTVYPPRPNRPSERFGAIARDSGATVILTLESLRSRLQSSVSATEGLQRLDWVTVDGIAREPAAADDWTPPRIEAESVAFLQYTSGSTASPKGTIISHANVLHNSRVISEAFESNEATVGIGWLPMTHDMGLIGNVLQPLYAGFPLVFMSPEHFLVKPIRWLQAISRYRGTTSGGPNFAYDFCSQRIKPESRESLDLSSWEVAFNGAEAVRPETVRRFSAEFSACGFRREAFYPCYGLAESTLMVTGGSKSTPGAEKRVNAAALQSNRAVVEDRGDDARPLIGCGRTRLDQQIVIADPETCVRRPDGQVGEIWISGPSVAAGYWRRPEETERVFRGYLRDSGEGPYLRSGDLGFLLDGELFVTGRLKDVIIIGGANHFPVDIEITVESCHDAIRTNCVAAFSVDVEGAERLVVVAEIDRHHRGRSTAGGEHGDARSVPRSESIEAAIRGAVARNHDLSTHAVCLIRQSTIPKTSSGKIQRLLCKQRYLARELEVVELPATCEPGAQPKKIRRFSP